MFYHKKYYQTALYHHFHDLKNTCRRLKSRVRANTKKRNSKPKASGDEYKQGHLTSNLRQITLQKGTSCLTIYGILQGKTCPFTMQETTS